ncbi:MAG TPA: hypothetical protein VHC44_08065 [Verrucomicrobiae bacterium]|nr:hypothetical protein [Verrucomicrobiae bacterium]
MVKKQNKDQRRESGVVLHVNLLGAVVFSIALVFAAAMVTYGVTRQSHPQPVSAAEASSVLSPAPAQTPPWGELFVRDIKIKPPEEYLAFELQHITPPAWNFDGNSVDRVRQLMLSSGLTPDEVSRTLVPSKISVSASAVTVHPDNDLVLSLAPQTRGKLYHELGHNAGNEHMRFPFCYSGNEFDQAFAQDKVSPAVTAMVKKLLYARGNLQCFSDYELVLLQIHDKEEQMRLLSTLSSESAVMAGVRIRPETDIEKLLGYWAWPGGIRVKDVQPLLESLKDVPDGRVGLVYLLPQFARQRLYTFPMPSRPGDPAMDCHWSTMNFFNDTPDDHFTDPAYTVNFLQTNYYQIANPTKYGDIILFLDGDSNNAIHSAVYLCDDLVFTKNGNNMAQPWMLMHLKDLTTKYESDGPGRMLVYRNRNW